MMSTLVLVGATLCAGPTHPGPAAAMATVQGVLLHSLRRPPPGSITVTLPPASPTPPEPKRSVILAPAPGGWSLHVDGVELGRLAEPVDAEAARLLLAGAVAAGDEVLISADASAPYAHVVVLIDVLKGLGVERFALNIGTLEGLDGGSPSR